MAAETLAAAGASVTVFERMPSVGRKFLLAGRGGLNLTHSEPLEGFLARYGPAQPMMAAAIDRFGPDDLRAWCAGLGQEPFVGSSGRVFPAGFRATPLLRAWLRRLDELGVEIRTRHEWTGWTDDGHALTFTDRTGPAVIHPSATTLLAFGGASWPRTGSNGAWAEVVEAAGIDVSPLRAANGGFVVDWTPGFAERFAGTPLKNVRLSVGRRRRGGPPAVRTEALITRSGIEGSGIYALSRPLRDAIDRTGQVTLTVDLQPDRSNQQVADRLTQGRPKDSISTALRRATGLAPVAIALLREATANQLPSAPLELAQLIKSMPLTLVGTAPIDRAISTAGGIDLDQVDESGMLRHRPGTFVAGEMLDWDAPTGGYLLQATFSTAVVAAQGAIAWLSAGAGGSTGPTAEEGAVAE
jgi:uncharacterized flavoprotein (TIGR03862 family)